MVTNLKSYVKDTRDVLTRITEIKIEEIWIKFKCYQNKVIVPGGLWCVYLSFSWPSFSFFYPFCWDNFFDELVLGSVHTSANWMQVSPHPIRTAENCDLLSMELVHISPQRLPCDLHRSPVHLLILFRILIQPKIWAEIRPETMNEVALDSCCEPQLAHMWTQPQCFSILYEMFLQCTVHTDRKDLLLCKSHPHYKKLYN